MRVGSGVALLRQTTNPKFLARPEQQNGFSAPAAATAGAVLASVALLLLLLLGEKQPHRKRAFRRWF